MKKVTICTAAVMVSFVLVSLGGCISVKKEVEEVPTTTTTTMRSSRVVPAPTTTTTVERTTY